MLFHNDLAARPPPSSLITKQRLTPSQVLDGALKRAAAAKTLPTSFLFQVTKLVPDQQLVFGWLYQCEDKHGKQWVDHSLEVISGETLEKAAYEFVLDSRQMGDMHQRMGMGRMVESCMFTREKCAAMGIPPGIMPVGLWVGFKVDDSATWAAIKRGDRKAWSLGGTAVRNPIRSA